MTYAVFGVIFMLTFELVASSSHSKISVFSNLKIFFRLEVMFIKNTSDISRDSLEKIIKVSGEEIVTGYIRFRKVRAVKGYKAAQDRAYRHFSKIIKGRKLEDGKYAVVVRFRLLVFILPLILIGIIFLLCNINPKAVEKEVETDYIIPEIPTVSIAQTDDVFYISIPGIVAETIEFSNPEIVVYNPVDNQCSLVYEAYYEEYLLGKSELILPGKKGNIRLANIPENGVFFIDIVAIGFSNNGKTRYNSVSQHVQITVI